MKRLAGSLLGSWSVLLLMGFLGVAESQASEPLNFSIHQGYISTRAMGMGNAFTALADDHNALFYNPAALALRERGNMHFFLRGGYDPGLFDFIGEIGDVEGTESEKAEALTDLIESKYGSHFGNPLFALGGFWVRPNWGMAFLPADINLDLALHRQVGPMINVSTYVDSTFVYGYGQSVDWLGANHPLALGATVKAVHRVYIGESVSVASLAAGDDVVDADFAKEGMTFDVDLGTLYSPPIPESGPFRFLQYMKPTFAVVVRNVLDYGFPLQLGLTGDSPGEPPPLQRRIDLGSVYQLPQLWVFDPRFSVDLRNILHDNWSFKKGLHVGAEFYWTMFNWWKGHWAAGLNQGHLSLGLGAKMAFFQFDLAYWGEEVGTPSAPNKSERFMLELSLDF